MSPATDTAAGKADASEETKKTESSAGSKKTDDGKARPKKGDEIEYDPVTGAYSDGLKDGRGREREDILNDLGVESLDDLKKRLTAATKSQEELEKANSALKQPENLPAVQELQKKLSDIEKAKSAAETRLREIEIASALETVAAKGAFPPRVMRTLFEDEHIVERAEDGRITIRDRSTNMPLKNAQGQPATAADAYEAWLKRHPEYQGTAQTAGSGSKGGGNQGQQEFSSEEIKKMSPEDYEKNRKQIMAQMRSQRPAG